MGDTPEGLGSNGWGGGWPGEINYKSIEIVDGGACRRNV